MIDPKTAVAGTNTLLSVFVFVGSQLSPSIMIRRAVKKELKVAALLKESGAIIGPEDWDKINARQDQVAEKKLNMPKLGEVFKRPIRLLLDAREYHTATSECLFEVRLASARATIDAARAAAIENNASRSPADGDTITTQDVAIHHLGDEIQTDRSPIEDASFEDLPGSHDSAMQIEDAFTTSFENVLVNAGADVRVTLHFGIGDVPVTITPGQHLIDIPVSYIGPLLLSGYAMLIPCDDDDVIGLSDSIVMGHYQQAYILEFYGMSWRSPVDYPVRVSTVPDDDSVSLASLEATYGGDRETIYMFDEDERLERREMFRRRREDVARVRD
ncbi:hypothetical protein K466DRAFT_650292 [Polyporus arcularius HHB13444]|uniref:Uncharacterized protein n=1 Tax=Polyporus arcularius HHB13444 TaxID=1314778 RepID=A0A5C3PW84_9APHY|nr:hypothetical protein K466DRAFT_650292 [Polyporus arcularius HHB13444]